MKNKNLEQRFSESYREERRIETGFNTAGQRQIREPAQASFVQNSSPARRRHALAIWNAAEALETIRNAKAETQRMVGDTAKVWHLDYKATSKQTRHWEAFGTAYGLRFIIHLWQEDIDFINLILETQIACENFTPDKPLELVVKRIDPVRGMSGVMAVFHRGQAVFLSEAENYEKPLTRKFVPEVRKETVVWPNSPFRAVGKQK